MPEVVLGAPKAADESIGGRAVPDNMIVIGTEDNEEASVNAKAQDKALAEKAPELPEEAKEGGPDGASEKGEKGEKEEPEGKAEKSSEGGFTVAGKDVSIYAEEYEKNGKLSGDSYKALEAAGFPRDMVDAYIRGLEKTVNEANELTQKEVSAILDSVGGEERYNRVMAWASEKLSKEEQDAYDKAVASSDPATARLVVQGLMARYEREHGSAPSLVMGSRSPSPEANAGFKDRSSMIKAMNDSRYGTDPDYTRDVERKVIASGLMRGRR